MRAAADPTPVQQAADPQDDACAIGPDQLRCHDREVSVDNPELDGVYEGLSGQAPGQSQIQQQDNSQSDALRPARGYSWLPFEPGNSIALIHGTYSDRALAERAELVHEELLATCPWLNEDRYAPSVQRYLDSAAREALAHQALMHLKPGAKGFTRLLEVATAASRLSWFMADALGLTPAGHSKLKMLTAGGEFAEQSLADLAREGRAIRERRQAAIDAQPSSLATESESQ